MPENRAEEVLDLLSDVLRESARAAQDGFETIAMLVDANSNLNTLLGEVCRFSGLPFHVAEKAASGIELKANNDVISPWLADVVRGLHLEDEPSGGHRAVTVDQAGGQLNVRIDNSAEPTNPGDRNWLGLLAALLDPALSGHRLAVVAYDETLMDPDGRDLTWSLLMDTLPRLVEEEVNRGESLGLPRTLLAVIGSATVDWERHVRAGPGVRWMMTNGAVSWRRRWETDRDDTASLMRGDGPLVVFLGAGASISSGLESGDDLRDKALAAQVPQLASEHASFEAQAREFYRATSDKRRLMNIATDQTEDEFVRTLTLERVLREEVHKSGPGLPPTLQDFHVSQKSKLDKPGPAIAQVRRLLRMRERLVLLTVNFDQLIEHDSVIIRGAEPDASDPLDNRPRIRLFVTKEEIRDFPTYYAGYRLNGGVVPLLKLHGSLEQPESIRANVDVTMPGLTPESAAALRCLLGGADHPPFPWIYVGCSMRDPDIMSLTNQAEFAIKTDERWVAPFPDTNVGLHIIEHREATWHRQEMPEDLRSRAITLTADAFLTLVAGLLIGGDPK